MREEIVFFLRCNDSLIMDQVLLISCLNFAKLITPLSDHNIISVNLMLSVEHSDTNRTPCLAKYKWKDAHQDKYVNNLHKPTALNQLHYLVELCSTTSN